MNNFSDGKCSFEGKRKKPLSVRLGDFFHAFQVLQFLYILLCMPLLQKWDTITIKQETEDGAHVESEIKVPFQASFPLQNFLNSLASLISCTLPPR